jgi:hypothetical protein
MIERHCNASIKEIETFLGQYHDFVTRREMDWGGNLTADEAASYRYEADLIAKRPLENLRKLRFISDNSHVCTKIVDETIDNIAQYAIAPRFGKTFGLKYDNGRWYSPRRMTK